MKKVFLLCGVASLIVSCAPKQPTKDVRCYGLLVDSLNNLATMRERVANLEQGADDMAKGYQAKIDAMQHIIDSLTHKRKPAHTIVKHTMQHHAKKVHAIAKPMVKDKSKSFVFDEAKQKYMFYDAETKTYYSVDPVSGERLYNNK
jgi:hypothetical protein